MAKKKNKSNTIEIIKLVGTLIITISCIFIVGFLLYQSLILKQTIPEYSLAFFTSVITYVLGSLNGGKSNE